MVDEELSRQWKDVAGARVLACDECGRPVEAGGLRLVEPVNALADDGERRVCPDCWEAIERGTEPVELEDEDDVELIG